ncbi:hypothetical protein Tco_0891941 [Tanacetum coccineum]|uniref:Uncharacterized protein n=1 Tax=Tanacetum coccineum TaxID=301880 RepID=A0ABQ5C9T3_9ASTR
MDEWSKSQNISSEQVERTELQPPPQAHTEHVNVVFTGSEKLNKTGGAWIGGWHFTLGNLYSWKIKYKGIIQHAWRFVSAPKGPSYNSRAEALTPGSFNFTHNALLKCGGALALHKKKNALESLKNSSNTTISIYAPGSTVFS